MHLFIMTKNWNSHKFVTILTSLSTGTFPVSCSWTVTTVIRVTQSFTSMMATWQDFVTNLKIILKEWQILLVSIWINSPNQLAYNDHCFFLFFVKKKKKENLLSASLLKTKSSRWRFTLFSGEIRSWWSLLELIGLMNSYACN